MARAKSFVVSGAIAACEPLFVAVAAMLEEGATLAASVPKQRTPRAYGARAAALIVIAGRAHVLAEAARILLAGEDGA